MNEYLSSSSTYFVMVEIKVKLKILLEKYFEFLKKFDNLFQNGMKDEKILGFIISQKDKRATN